jgi:TonB family protein
MNTVMNTAVTRNDWVGRVIDGRFPLLEWLGSTEQAGVFRTELKGPQPQRAVIRLMPANAENAEKRLLDWASAAKLSHPHLMRIFESGRTPVGGADLLYVVTEYAEESLAQVIPERPLSAGEAREMLVPALDALSYLHGQGMVHGRIKPSNVMVSGDRLKLPVDNIQSAGRFAKPSAKLAIYDAPEIASGEISPAADLWSLGITLVESLTQHPPQWDRWTKRDPVVPADLPQPFAEIARGCLRHDPSKRATVRDIKVLLDPPPSLEEPANEFDQIAPADIGNRTEAFSVGTRSKGRIAAMIGGIVLALIVIVFAFTRSHQSQPASPAAAQPQAPAVTPLPAQSSVSPSSLPTGQMSKGEVAERVMPDVSASANRTIHGKVDVNIRVNVDAKGNVANARFDSHGSSRYFAARALDAARKWRFKPPQRNGQPVPSVWILRFQFRRNGPEVAVSDATR